MNKTKNNNNTIRQLGVDDADAYWKNRYAKNDTSERRLHRFIAKVIEQNLNPADKVLDCGVGSGHVFRLCRKKFEIYGVEQSSEAIRRYDFPVDNIKQTDLNEGVPDFGVKFDIIVVSMVLHWLDEPDKFLRQAAKHLSEKGKLLIVIPNIVFYKNRLAYLFGKFPPISLSHKNFQVPYEAEKMFNEAGYKIEKKLTPRQYWRARLWPNLFSTDIVYLLSPCADQMRKPQNCN